MVGELTTVEIVIRDNFYLILTLLVEQPRCLRLLDRASLLQEVIRLCVVSVSHVDEMVPLVQ